MPGGAPVTLLFSDIEASTRLARELGARYGEVLREHQRLVREAIARHGGREIDTQGDSFFVAFARPESAVLAARDMQRALAAKRWPDGQRVKIRIGIHTGRAEEEDGRYTGLAVHRAARVCAAAHGGQILVSQSVHNLLEDEAHALDGLAFRPLGEHRLKDFDRPVALFQVTARGLEAAFPHPRTADDSTRAAAAVPGWRRHRRALAALALLASAAIAAVVARPWAASSAPDVVPNSIVGIDPEANEVVSVLRLPAPGGDVAVAGGRLWVVSGRSRVLVRVDPDGGDPRTTGIPGSPEGWGSVTGDGRGHVWVTSGRDPLVYRVDAETAEITKTVRVPGVAQGVVAGGGFVWVSGSAEARYHRGPGLATAIDIQTGRPAFQIPVEGTPFFTTFGLGALWVSNYDAGTVSVIRLGRAKAESFTVAPGPLGLAAGEGAVWVGAYWNNQVVRVHPGSFEVEKVIPVGGEPLDVLAAYGAVWVTSRATRTIYRIDPRSNRVVAKIRLPYTPGHLTAGLGRVWASVQRCEPERPCF